VKKGRKNNRREQQAHKKKVQHKSVVVAANAFYHEPTERFTNEVKLKCFSADLEVLFFCSVEE
jgi:purine-nucleoside phosphorylase